MYSVTNKDSVKETHVGSVGQSRACSCRMLKSHACTILVDATLALNPLDIGHSSTNSTPMPTSPSTETFMSLRVFFPNWKKLNTTIIYIPHVSQQLTTPILRGSLCWRHKSHL